MGHVSWNYHDDYEEEPAAECNLQRPNLESLDVSPTFPDKTLRLVEWLATTPSKRSLKQLVVPFRAHNAPELVSLFGPTIERLTTPIRRLQSTSRTVLSRGFRCDGLTVSPSASLIRYAALTELTLLIHKCTPRSRWDALPIALASLPSPPIP